MIRSAFLCLLLPIALVTTPAYSCLCEDVPLDEEFKNTGFVFKGSVMSIQRLQFELEYIEGRKRISDQWLLSVEVEKVWKGELVADRVSVVVNTEPSACGVKKFREESYYFFADRLDYLGNDVLTTDRCAYPFANWVDPDFGKKLDILAKTLD